MEGTTPDRPTGGIPGDPVLRDPALPAPGPLSGESKQAKEPDSGKPTGPGGSSRGSLRRAQWTTPPAGDRPGGEAGEDGDVTRPVTGGPRRATMTAAVLAAVLLVGLGGVVAAEVHGHGNDTSGPASQDVSANSRLAPVHPVQHDLPSASPGQSSKNQPKGPGKNQPKGPGMKQPPAPTGGRTQAGPAPLAFWRIGSGPGSLGTDVTNAFPATVHDVARGSGHGGSGIFNGTDSQLTTASPVLGTGPGQSFTVSAWVYLTSTSRFATAVSQDGGTRSAFFLQYSRADNRWAFSRNRRALSAAPPRLRTWTHLVGVYDAGSGQLALYVNGGRRGTAHETSPVSSAGELAVGRGKANGKYSDWFPGRINDVKVFGTALTAAQVRQI